MGTAFLTLVLSLLSGCNAIPARVNAIPATQLPLEFRAQQQSIRPPQDLSVLASRSLNSDLIYPGDVLDINLVTGAEEETPEPLPYRVNPDGTVELPLVGSVPVAGLTLKAAEAQIREIALGRRIYRDPLVSVLLNTRQTDRVRVVGAVKEPGDYETTASGQRLACRDHRRRWFR